jgi:hypothetical protein
MTSRLDSRASHGVLQGWLPKRAPRDCPILLAILAAAFLIAPSAAFAAPPRDASTGVRNLVTAREPMDRAACGTMLQQVRAGASRLSAADRNVLASVTDSDCVIVDSTTITSVAKAPASGAALDLGIAPDAGRVLTAAGPLCQTYDKSKDIYLGPISAMTRRVQVQMCYNGNTAWTDWGPRCWFTAIPVYGTDITWCGVYHSGYWETNPGLNGDYFTWAMPWWKLHYPWMRYRVFGDGTSSAVWGGLD